VLFGCHLIKFLMKGAEIRAEKKTASKFNEI